LFLIPFYQKTAMKLRNCYQLSLAIAVFCGSGLATARSANASSFSYTVQDLGTFSGGTYSSGYALNNNGQVVGDADVPNASSFGSGSHAFLYSDGSLQDLGTLPGDNYSGASGINNNGQIVGTSSNSSGSNHAFLFSDGSLQSLGTLAGGTYSIASGINDQGQVIGSANTGPSGSSIYGDKHAFISSSGSLRDLGTLAGDKYSDAYGINNQGQVVGTSSTSSGSNHAFLYSDGALQDLGALPTYKYSAAYGINNRSQIVGDSFNISNGFPSTEHAFLYSEGLFQDLGTLGGNSSEARSINELGQVVGESSTSDGRAHAFLYRDDALIDLNSLIPTDSGWVLEDAFGINQDGQIVGYGTINGETHAFLATDPPATAVPEPDSILGTVALAAFGMGTWLKRFRKRKNLTIFG